MNIAPALVLNPFTELSESFRTEEIGTAAKDLSVRRRIDAKEFGIYLSQA